jgi:hypothetical protein
VNGNGGDIEVPRSMEPFVDHERLLGYDDARVGRADTTVPENSETNAVYERLRTDKTFIARSRRAISCSAFRPTT